MESLNFFVELDELFFWNSFLFSKIFYFLHFISSQMKIAKRDARRSMPVLLLNDQVSS